MLLNQQLRYHLIKYLSTFEFKDYEFKDIFNGFIDSNPNFKNINCYQKIYHYIRVLENNGLILIKQTNPYYKYSSNYTYDDLLKNLNDQNIECLKIKNELDKNIKKISDEINSLKKQIEYCDKYKNIYPTLKSKISSYRSELSQKIHGYEAEVKVIKSLI
ncbi:hypothetical protein [Acinetobacter indicus]|uniref:hypothetical protein n=1 Tax=Acinetobacter indicus TaxID=756892 RepID=UPI00209B89EC|nr:hypothetical protein [Acinetobacter indicus]MCO8087621.1 hypothetical protein [Acinetobacter indicus]